MSAMLSLGLLVHTASAATFAWVNGKVGVQNFGKSPLSEDEFLGTESVRLCIDRVVLTN